MVDPHQGPFAARWGASQACRGVHLGERLVIVAAMVRHLSQAVAQEGRQGSQQSEGVARPLALTAPWMWLAPDWEESEALGRGQQGNLVAGWHQSVQSVTAYPLCTALLRIVHRWHQSAIAGKSAGT